MAGRLKVADYRLKEHVYSEPFSCCVAVGFDVVQNKDGLHDRGGAAWTAAQLDQDFQVLRVALARSPQARMRVWRG